MYNQININNTHTHTHARARARTDPRIYLTVKCRMDSPSVGLYPICCLFLSLGEDCIAALWHLYAERRFALYVIGYCLFCLSCALAMLERASSLFPLRWSANAVARSDTTSAAVSVSVSQEPCPVQLVSFCLHTIKQVER